MSPTEAPLVLDGLCRYYGDVVGVEGLDLRLEAGEIVGLVGLNGAGKSTTLRLALGLLSPSAGECRLFGENSRDACAVRRRLGYLPSEVSLYRDRTASENLDLLQSLNGAMPASLLPRRHELAARLDLSATDLSRMVGEMSHGMRQKIGILQALEHDPDLVVLDEPSDGLDPIARAVLAELLVEVRERGGSVLLASHVLTEIERVADRVAILHRGKLVAMETVTSLRQRGKTRLEATFDGPAPCLDGIDRLDVIQNGDGRLIARAHPPLDPVLKALAKTTVISLDVREASLEDLVHSIADGDGR